MTVPRATGSPPRAGAVAQPSSCWQCRLGAPGAATPGARLGPPGRRVPGLDIMIRVCRQRQYRPARPAPVSYGGGTRLDSACIRSGSLLVWHCRLVGSEPGPGELGAFHASPEHKLRPTAVHSGACFCTALWKQNTQFVVVLVVLCRKYCTILLSMKLF